MSENLNFNKKEYAQEVIDKDFTIDGLRRRFTLQLQSREGAYLDSALDRVGLDSNQVLDWDSLQEEQIERMCSLLSEFNLSRDSDSEVGMKDSARELAEYCKSII